MRPRLRNMKRNPEVCSNTINIPLLRRRSTINRRSLMNKIIESTNLEAIVNMRREIATTKVVRAVDAEG